jgi:glycine betaine/choline ABC-type transport system substrate-binding protein
MRCFTRLALLATILLLVVPATSSARPPMFGVPRDCLTNGFCAPGLEHVYGVSIKDYSSTYAPGAAMYKALRDRRVSVIVGFNTDPQLRGNAYRVLRDDRAMTGTDNIVPVFEDDLKTAYGDAFVDRLNLISSGLTTNQLRSFNAQAAARVPVQTIVDEYLASMGLAGTATTTIDGPTIRIVSQAFMENRILALLYTTALKNGGYDVVVENAPGFRSVTYDRMRYRRDNMSIEYAASLAEFLAGNVGFRSSSIDTTMKVVNGWLAKDGLLASRPAPGVNSNVFVVMPRTANLRNLTKLSDLRRQELPMVSTKPIPSETQAGPTAAATSNPVLMVGSFGPQVRALQLRLQRLEFYTGEIDSSFGPATKTAVMAFQRDKGLTVDGIVGRQTRLAILSAVNAA